jgi:hypothetical protein
MRHISLGAVAVLCLADCSNSSAAPPQQGSNAKLITVGPNVLVSKTHSDLVHDEVLLNADPSNPNRLIGCSLAKPQAQVMRPYGNGGIGANPWWGVAYISDDAGKTWWLSTEYQPTATANAMDNHCAFGPDGTAYFVQGIQETNPPKPDPPRDDLDYDPDSHDFMYLFSRRSTDGGHTWSDWYKIPQSVEGDRQYVIADDSNSKYRGRVYVTGHVGVLSVHGEKQGTAFTLWRSLDNGATFERPLARLGAKLPSEFNPWTPVILSDGTLACLFVDISDLVGNYRNGQAIKPLELRILFSRDGGESLSKSYKVTDVNNFGHTPFDLAVDRSEGPFKDRLYTSWADGKKGERSNIYIAYSADKGKTWSKPIVVNDDRIRFIKDVTSDKGPEDTIPVVAVNRAGVVGVMWYDRRDNPHNEGYWARFSASTDGGETWSPSVRVSDKPKTYLHGERTIVFAHEMEHDNKTKDAVGDTHVGVNVGRDEWIEGGHTSGLAADGHGQFHALWIDNRTGIEQVYTAPIDVAGASIKNGSPELAELNDVSDKVDLQVMSTSYDEKSQTVTISARLKNHSKETLRGPMKARVVVLQSDFAIAHVASADNQMTGTGAVWDFSSLLNNNELKPGETSQAKTLVFRLQDVWPLDVTGRNGVMSRSLVNFEAKVLAKQ